ncbi:hypothetical protein CDAR_315191 [Caerostris darwini]|uniref:Uncharacterized protein n=1 Tax=Caerostris darwini TaxID=1538125 RepID=A0AAV4T853_9ARAC|nr:hypothetical protein CDAR_315191 [Caerostris darwini]
MINKLADMSLIFRHNASPASRRGGGESFLGCPFHFCRQASSLGFRCSQGVSEIRSSASMSFLFLHLFQLSISRCWSLLSNCRLRISPSICPNSTPELALCPPFFFFLRS